MELIGFGILSLYSAFNLYYIIIDPINFFKYIFTIFLYLIINAITMTNEITFVTLIKCSILQCIILLLVYNILYNLPFKSFIFSILYYIILNKILIRRLKKYILIQYIVITDLIFKGLKLNIDSDNLGKLFFYVNHYIILSIYISILNSKVIYVKIKSRYKYAFLITLNLIYLYLLYYFKLFNFFIIK
jgi:hypothetical protein